MGNSPVSNVKIFEFDNRPFEFSQTQSVPLASLVNAGCWKAREKSNEEAAITGTATSVLTGNQYRKHGAKYHFEINDHHIHDIHNYPCSILSIHRCEPLLETMPSKRKAAHEKDDLKLISLINHCWCLLHFDEEMPDVIPRGINQFVTRSPRNAAVAREWVFRRCMMNEAEIDTFWKQVYFFSFANHGLRVPDEELPSLEEMREEFSDRETWVGVEKDEAMFPDNDGAHDQVFELDFSEQQMNAMEYFNWQVNKYGKYMQVPGWVQELLRRPSSDSTEDDSESRPVHKAACNCPHCWEYMEDVALFMEHLWIEHAVVEDRMDLTGDQNAVVHPSKSNEDPQDRKDSGYSDTMDISETVEDGEQAESQDEGDSTIDPALLTPAAPKLRAASIHHESLRSDMNTSFWQKLLEHSIRSRARAASRANTLTTTAPTNPDRRELEKALEVAAIEAQKVRDDAEAPMFSDPLWTMTSLRETGRRIHRLSAAKEGTEEAFRRVMSPHQSRRSSSFAASNADSSIDSESTSFDNDKYNAEDRYWICAHDEDCQMKFESLVLYLEHLTQRGYVVYARAAKRQNEMMSPVKRLQAQ